MVMICSLAVLGACAWAAPPPPRSADRIVIRKLERTLTLYDAGRVLATYRVALGSSPLGPKEREGDGRTPEGRYVVDSKRTATAYHLALHLSYPNSDDLARARRLGVQPGGDILIHGLPTGRGWLGPLHRAVNWTRGCVAVTNSEIEEIWRMVPVGTEVLIEP